MTQHFDIIIIGGGFAGAATAYQLSRRSDFKILLLEKEASCGQYASGRNAAMLRQAVPSAAVGALIQETRAALALPPDDWPHPVLFQQNGSVLLGKNSQVSALHSSLKSVSAVGEVYARGMFPSSFSPGLRDMLGRANYESLLWTPGDGVVDIKALLANYLQSARGRGMALQTSSPVLKMSRDSEAWLVQCPTHRYRAPVVVNAAGAWAGVLASDAGLSAPEFRSFRRHLFLSPSPPEVDPRWPFIWDMEHEYYFRPEFLGLMLCPGDEELHPTGEPETDSRQWEILGNKLKNYFPGLGNVSQKQGWACLRTKLSQKDFLIEEDPRAEGFFYVAALGGHGMSSSLGVGRLGADKIIQFFEGEKLETVNKCVTL